MADYEINLTTDTGTVLASLHGLGDCTYALVTKEIGAAVLTLPGDFDKTLLKPDRKIKIWRTPDGGSNALEAVYFLRIIKDKTDRDGVRTITITGLGANYLLSSRIVAYDANTAYTSKTDQADDMLKAIVRENLGASATDTARRFNATYFSVQADSAAGPSLTKSFCRDNVLATCQDIAEAAKTAGTDLYFDIVSPTPSTLEFRTYTGQPGQDHTFPNGVNPVVLSVDDGTLAEPELIEDYSGEVSYVYAGGQGQESARNIQTATDATRAGRSIWARREAFAQANNESTDAGVTAVAQQKLAERRPKIRFTGRIVDTDEVRYGIEWKQGDKVSAVFYDGQQFDCVITAVTVKLDKNGKEEIRAYLEYTE